MGDSITAMASMLDALETRYQTVAHNLANVNTAGFKKRRSMFEEALASQEAEAGPEVTTPTDEIKGTTTIDFGQGAAIQTGRPLDLSLTGDGFFTIDTPKGPLYTRNGAFHVNANRQLVDTSGRTIAGAAGAITLPAGASAADVSVSPNGEVRVGIASLGRLRITRFNERDLLTPMGTNVFQAPPGEAAGEREAEAGSFSIQQGFQEGSNVTMVEELVDLITVSRLYEANIKSVSGQDGTQDSLLNVAMA